MAVGKNVGEESQYELVIEDVSGEENTVSLNLGEVVVGRDPQSDVHLDERNVSRQHVRLLHTDEGVFAEDLNSYNGLWFNGDRVQGRHKLAAGDRLEIGDFRLELRGDDLEERVDATEDTQVSGSVLEPTQPNYDPVASGSSFWDVETQPGSPMPEVSPEAELEDEATAVIRPEDQEKHIEQMNADSEALETVPAHLIVVSGPMAGSEFAIDAPDFTIGRTDENRIRIDHRSVSRQHARILVKRGRVTLVDLGSANGTLINGEEYAQTDLKHGDLVELGHIHARFVASGDVYRLTADEEEAIANAHRGITEEAESAASSEGPPQRLVFLSAVMVVLLVVVTFSLYRSGDVTKTRPVAKTPPAAKPKAPEGGMTYRDPDASKFVMRAQSAFEGRDWAETERLAKAALALEGKRQDAKDLLDASQRELRSLVWMREARAAAATSQWQRAWDQVSRVSENSVYYDEPFVAQVKEARLGELEAVFSDALEQGRLDQAEALVRGLGQLETDEGRISAMARRLSEARAKRAPEPVRPARNPRPRRPSQSPQKSDKPATRSPMDHYVSGTQALREGAIDEAIDQFSQCLKADRRFGRCYRALGIAYARGGNAPKAARFYELYLRYAPDAPDADQVRAYLEQYRQR